jgi:hypothetical protein
MRKVKYLILAFIIVASVFSQAVAGTLYEAEVMDISDRNYEETLIELIDNADTSIVMSMYLIKPGEDKKHTVNRLMKDLEEAAFRGVEVKIYLNSKLDERDYSILDMLASEPYKRLKEKGAQILLINPRYKLHDKMIIVDSRFIVLGSTNWSITALEDNLEASVLIDSPDLASEQLARLKTIHLAGEKLSDPPQISIAKIYALPEVLKLPKVLMEEEGYFPKMMSRADKRAMDLYLLLLAQSRRLKKNSFYISLERFGADLGMPEDWSDTDIRRQVIKSLNKLADTYGLIEVQFKKARPAYITMKEFDDNVFEVDKALFMPYFLNDKAQAVEYIGLIEAYLNSKDRSIDEFCDEDLAEMFYVSRSTIRKGREE